MSSRCSRKLPSLRRAAAIIESRASSAVLRLVKPAAVEIRSRLSLSRLLAPRAHTRASCQFMILYTKARARNLEVYVCFHPLALIGHIVRVCAFVHRRLYVGKPTKVKRTERVFVLGIFGPFGRIGCSITKGTICRALRCVNGRIWCKKVTKGLRRRALLLLAISPHFWLCVCLLTCGQVRSFCGRCRITTRLTDARR